jgi:hypothetical protein
MARLFTVASDEALRGTHARMNTSALKAFAPAVRKQLIEAVSRKLDFALTARTPDYLDTYAPQVHALRELATADRKGLIERVAYTWFNRLAALRYLDARNWHPFHVKVLMAASGADTLPELFTVARLGAVPEELRRYIDVGRIEALLQGRIPSGDPQGEVYRLLVLAACRFYNEILPDVFERLDDETELLLPEDLLTEQSVAQGFRTEITDEDCDQVEVLGWLYQFYISEKKDQVMARKAAVPAEDIPAVTQLFTPHWIVRYLVENSLGRLWLLNRPESLLKAWMPYYIESAEPETEFLHIERPQDIRLGDPAVGSGHMLTYAFDLLYVIYEEEGYAPSEIAALIFRHNLTGIEIDARAAQLAALALTLKGREKSPRFFQQQHFVRPNIVELRDIRFAEGELLGYGEALGLGGLFTPPILQLMHQFEDAKNFGSLIQPCVEEMDIAFARGSVEARDLGSNLFLTETHKKVLRVLQQAEALTQRYQVIAANPPYLGGKQMPTELKGIAAKQYRRSKADLFSMFIERSLLLSAPLGYTAMVTMQSWMFLSSFVQLRAELISEKTVLVLAHLGSRAFDSIGGEVVQAAAFCLKNAPGPNCVGTYLRLTDGRNEAEKAAKARLSAVDTNADFIFRLPASEFRKIPESPFAYWVSAAFRQAFRDNPRLEEVAKPRVGMNTTDNQQFLRRWHEVPISKVGFGVISGEKASVSAKKWFPYNKGGSFRRWYGNNEYLVNWQENGRDIKACIAADPKKQVGGRINSSEFYFLPSVTWTFVSGDAFAARLCGAGFVFDVAGSSIFPTAELRHLLLAYLNSTVVYGFLRAMNPTVNFQAGNVSNLPLKTLQTNPELLRCSEYAEEAVSLSRADWDSFETSWDFRQHPLLTLEVKSGDLRASWFRWAQACTAAKSRMQVIEVENNRLLSRAFGLQDEVVPDVNLALITLTSAEIRRDVASFISYAVGCTMGRYSQERPGLILASAGEGLNTYFAMVGKVAEELAFTPDRDGIIPVLDDEWFTDDIVARTREFLKATFGEATLRENIRFIEESLGRDLRSYFLNEFYKDHLQTYKKRPIYWMVQSPRKGFSVLIYLHRYTRDTMNVILNRYLRDFQVKLRSRIEHLQQVGTSASASNREKAAAAKELTKLTRTLHECEEWERQTILPLAQARIDLDLDDGVKVNYQKLGEALVKIPGFEAAEE